MRALALLLLFAVSSCGLGAPVLAQHDGHHGHPLLGAQARHHPKEDEDVHTQFYSTWMRPDMPTVSCCNKLDCAPAESRMVNGEWQARRKGDKSWLKVPASKIELNRDSPDGRSHLCAQWGQVEIVFCFIAGSGT